MSAPGSETGQPGRAHFDPPAHAHVRLSTPVELLDRAFAVLMSRPALFFGLGALGALPGLAATTVLALSPPAAGAYAGGDSRFALVTILAWVLEQWPLAAIVLCAFQILVLPRRPLPIWVAMQGALPRLAAFASTRMLSWIVVLGMLLFVFTGGGLAPGGLWVLVAIPAALMAAYLAVGWALLSPVIMIERLSLVRALQRSAELMRQKFASRGSGDSPFIRLLLILLFPLALIALEQGVVHSVGFFLPGGSLPEIPLRRDFLLFAAAVSFVGKMIREPWTFIALVMLYAECRMRREAFDLRLRLIGDGEGGEA